MTQVPSAETYGRGSEGFLFNDQPAKPFPRQMSLGGSSPPGKWKNLFLDESSSAEKAS
jgi:hypothetical protein